MRFGGGAPQESDESRGLLFGSALPEVLKATAKLGTAESDDGVRTWDGPVHPGAFEARADSHLASGLHYASRSAQALGVELWVAHTLAVGLEIMETATSLVGARNLAAEGLEQSPESSGVEFLPPALRPLSSSWGSGTVQSFSEFAQVLFGMKAVDDLHGLRKLIFRDVPDPRSAVAEHDLTGRLIETTSPGLACDARGERRTLGSGVCCPSAL